MERDFFDRGHDLAVLLADGRYRLVDNVIRGLPRDSHYVAAVADDEEMAAQSDPPAGAAHPRMTDWSPETERLANLEDLMRVQVSLLAAQLSQKKPKRPQPAARPVTAWERAARRRRWEQHREIVSRVLPSGDRPPRSRTDASSQEGPA